jgi:hypothetical protein
MLQASSYLRLSMSRDLLVRFHMTDCKSTTTPFLSGVHLEDGGDTPLVDNTLYQQLVGSLLYLTHTQPDLSYVVGEVSRYMQEPHELHWKASKHILRYVQGTTSYGIHYATVVHWISWDSQILIGLVITQITSPLLGTCLVWVLVPSVGQAKSNQQFLYRQ